MTIAPTGYMVDLAEEVCRAVRRLLGTPLSPALHYLNGQAEEKEEQASRRESSPGETNLHF